MRKGASLGVRNRIAPLIRLAFPSRQKRTQLRQTFQVEGMHCPACVAHATGVLTGLPGVIAVSVDLEAKSAAVDSESALDPAAVLQALASVGDAATVPAPPLFAPAPSPTDFVFEIRGMACASCVRTVAMNVTGALRVGITRVEATRSWPASWRWRSARRTFVTSCWTRQERSPQAARKWWNIGACRACLIFNVCKLCRARDERASTRSPVRFVGQRTRSTWRCIRWNSSEPIRGWGSTGKWMDGRCSSVPLGH